MADHNNSRNTALITGSSKGIGYELTKQFAKHKNDVVLVSRSKEKLENFGQELEKKYGINVEVFPKDLSEPGSARELYNEIESQGIRISILVNNAGFSIFGNFLENDLEEELDMIQLNLVSITELTKLFGQSMLERGSGKILNHASTAGAYPVPKMAVYAAIKSYLISFSISLNNELSETGIDVTALCTPETDTDLFEKGNMDESKLSERDLLDPEDVAEQGYKGLMKGKTIIVPGGLKRKLLFNLPRFVSRESAASIARNYVSEE